MLHVITPLSVFRENFISNRLHRKTWENNPSWLVLSLCNFIGLIYSHTAQIVPIVRSFRRLTCFIPSHLALYRTFKQILTMIFFKKKQFHGSCSLLNNTNCSLPRVGNPALTEKLTVNKSETSFIQNACPVQVNNQPINWILIQFLPLRGPSFYYGTILLRYDEPNCRAFVLHLLI